MILNVGQTLASVTDSTAIVVIRAPSTDVDLTCGGAAMLDPKDSSAQTRPAVADHSHGTLLGKRYEDPDGILEVLCTKGGTSSLALGGSPLSVKTAKALPASD